MTCSALGTPISIGKTAALYRVSSDAGKVHRTLTGHVPEELDKVIYDEAGDPIPIFNTGYSREWREWNGMQSENLDAMADDQKLMLLPSARIWPTTCFPVTRK